GDGDLLAVDISSDARFHRRLAVPEYVERDAQARGQILPVLHPSRAVVLQAVQAIRALGIRLGWIQGARRERFRQRRALEPVEAEAGVDRGSLDGPFVLREKAH